jgi:L-threonylcarbamoyladenylate synthase
MSLLLEAEALAAHLRAGHPGLFPTDTLPALAAQPEASAQIWRLKRRPPDKPLILMGADLDQLQALLAVPWHQEWLELAHRCWPGAVTLVLPIAGPLTEWLNPGGTSLGLRVPAAAAAQALLRRSGPMATTSANRSGAPPALNARQAAAAFPELALLAPVPWAPGSGAPSQVLAWVPASQAAPGRWQVLRPAQPATGDNG